ncbi:hypothetical protein [Actinoplanes derwentensis]|nr:hypothetical protein [Actinoplanes derwentensis]GID81277.1 peptidoglycan-binding protein [Actinoplanes derwentensis]
MRRWWLATGLVLALAGAGAAAVAVTRHRADPETPPPAPVAATTKIERRDLATSKTLDGTIGYGTARPFAGHRQATVTWLPTPGTRIKRGKQLYRADDLPVPLFYGSMPLYRPITGKGLLGRDVRIVADNLRALGYRTGPVKGGEEAELTEDLIAGIKRWQKDLGLPDSGTIAVGDVEVLSGAVRVDSVMVQPGAPANGELMTVTSTRKVISVPAELSHASSIERRQKVTVVLPDEKRIPAKVLAVGRTVAPPEGNDSPRLSVTVVVDDPSAIAKIDSADVEIEFAGQVRKDILAVPVEALIALAEGGYALQLPDGSLAAVETGMFATGWVEVTGLDEGTSVVVPG